MVGVQSASSGKKSFNQFSETALHEAARGGQIEVVKSLVENGAEVNAKDEYEHTALHEAALRGHIDVVKYLVENGAEVYAVNEFGRTALHMAALIGHIDVLIYLVVHGAEVNAGRMFGKTALHWAATEGHIDVVKDLVENGAVEDKSLGCAIILCAETRNVVVLRSLVEYCTTVQDAGRESLQNAIIWAAENANVMVLNFLVEYCTKVQDAGREDELREAMLKIDTLKKMNKTLERQVNKSSVRSEVVGVPLDDVVDVTREFNSSGPREARPLKSQFDVLTFEDFSKGRANDDGDGNNNVGDSESPNQIENGVLVEYAGEGRSKYYVLVKPEEAGEYLEGETKKTFTEDEKQLVEASLRNMGYGANVNTWKIVKKPGHFVRVECRENNKSVTRDINVGADVVTHENVYCYDKKTKSLAKETLNVREIRSQKQLEDDIYWLHLSGLLKQGQAEYYRFGDWVISFSLENFYVGVQFVGRIIDGSENELPQEILEQLKTNYCGLADATYKGMRKGGYRIFLAKEWMKGMNNNVIDKNPTVYEACLTLAVFLSECCRNLRTYVVNMMGIDLIDRGKLTTNEFLDNHPMARGGAWHNQEENRPTVIPLEEKIVRLWMEDRTVIRSTEN